MPTEEKIQKIPLAKAFVSERNTRQPKPTDPDVIELASSLTPPNKQTTPGIARPHPKKKGCFEIAAGARRRVALELVKSPTIDLIVREMDDQEFDDLIIVENLQRVDPDPRAEAEVLQRLVAKGVRTVKDIAARLGKAESWVARRMKLLSVIPELLKKWKPGDDLGHYSVEMMELLGALPEAMQKSLAKNMWSLHHKHTRKALEGTIAEQLCRLDTAPFKLDDPRFFVEGCGPGCASDSSKDGLLFDAMSGGKKKDSCARCLNTGCFNSRLAKWRDAEYQRLCAEEGDLPVYSESGQDLLLGNRKVKPNHRTWELEKKPATGATKVILISRDGGMKYAWLPKTSSSSSKGCAGKPVSPEAKRKEGIKTLQGKRWLAVREKLVEAIKKTNLKGLQVPLDDLIATFGLPFSVTSDPGGPTSFKIWEMFDNRKKGWPVYSNNAHPPRNMKTIVSREESLWPAMQLVLLRLIPEPRRVCDVPSFEEMYLRIGQIIGFPTDSAKKHADLQILPPKSWGKVDPHTLKPIK